MTLEHLPPPRRLSKGLPLHSTLAGRMSPIRTLLAGPLPSARVIPPSCLASLDLVATFLGYSSFSFVLRLQRCGLQLAFPLSLANFP